MSKRRADLSSEAVANAWPFGWYWRQPWNRLKWLFRRWKSPRTEWPASTHTNAIHVGRVTEECLLWRLFTYIPQFACFVHGASDIGFLVWRQWDGYDVAAMRIEFGRLFTRFQVPLANFHVARAGDEVVVIEKTARTQKALVTGQLANDFRCTGWISIVDIVNGAHVIHSTAGYRIEMRNLFVCIHVVGHRMWQFTNEISGCGERNAHHPRRTQRDNLIARKSISITLDVIGWFHYHLPELCSRSMYPK